MSKTNNTKNTVVVFLDAIGRTIMGKVANEDKNSLSVENPCLIHVQPNQATNQLQLQILPLFFKEFLADKTTPTIWTYNKSNITVSNPLSFAPQFIAQYEQMWETAPPPSEPKVVKLFDEE